MKRLIPAARLGLAAAMLLLSACRQDMHNQPKYIPLRSSAFWPDGQGSRRPVTGTVARGELRADAYFYTGKNGVMEGDRYPFPVTLQVVQRGQERFNVYCAPCHSRVGDGNGMIVQRGYAKAASLIGDARVVKAPVGHYYDVISNGWGAMPDYQAQVAPADRWAIAAYIRALQLSQNASMNDVPPEMRGKVLDAQQIRINGQSLDSAELSGHGGVPVATGGASATGPNPQAGTQHQVEGTARPSAPTESPAIRQQAPAQNGRKPATPQGGPKK